MCRTILIIDDERDYVEMVKIRLEANGYRVLTAYDGDQGLKLAKQRPDLILLDVTMPTVSGIEVCQLLKEDRELKDIPIIFVSGTKPTKEDSRRGFAAGGDEYIVKPFDHQELLGKIRRILEERAK